jgi:hypothetical protein
MNEDIPLPFDLPAVARKKVSTAFDGGWIIPKARTCHGRIHHHPPAAFEARCPRYRGGMRVRLAFAAACPDATLIRHIAAALMPTGP